MVAEPQRNRIILDVAASALAGYLLQPVMLASNIYVRRALGPYLAGVIATLTIIQTYTQLANLGILQVAERELPFWRGAGNEVRFRDIRVVALIASLALGALVAAGIGVYAYVFRNQLGSEMAIGLAAYAFLTILTQWTMTYVVLLRAAQKFIYLARMSVILGMSTALVNVCAVTIAGFYGMLAATMAIAVVTSVVYTREVRYLPRVAEVAERREPLLAEGRVLVTMGIPMLVLSVGHIALGTVDNIIALRLLGTVALGVYTIALSGGAIVFAFANTTSGVLYPRMQEAYGRERTMNALEKFVVQPTLALGVGLPFLIAPLFFGLPVLVEYLLPKFASGLPAFRVLVVGIYFHGLAQIQKTALVSLNRLKSLFAWSVVTTLTCAVGAATLVRVGWGLTGVALGTSVGYAVGFVGVSLQTQLLWKSSRESASWVALCFVPLVHCASVMPLLDMVLSPVGAGPLVRVGAAVAKVLIYYLTYIPVLWMTESHTSFFRDYARPAIRRVLRWRS